MFTCVLDFLYISFLCTWLLKLFVLIKDSFYIKLYYLTMQDFNDDEEYGEKTPLERGIDLNRSSIVYCLVKHCGQNISTIDQVHS